MERLPPLEELLPHRAPMILIDEVVSFDLAAAEPSLTAAVTAKPQWCENWVAIEFMAQTAAALVGLADRAAGFEGAPRPGFLLGTRKLELKLERFEVGRRYLITAKNTFQDAQAASFSCEIAAADAPSDILATAALNAFRPDDISAILPACAE